MEMAITDLPQTPKPGCQGVATFSPTEDAELQVPKTKNEGTGTTKRAR